MIFPSDGQIAPEIEALTPQPWWRFCKSTQGQIGLAGFELCFGHRALRDYPDCDGLYIGGGAWLAEPAAYALENEFGKPVVCNQTAAIREMMILLDDWKAMPGRGRLLATP
jgi:hypothetical protein